VKAVRARVHGAVSILNAIPTGIGGGLGIGLYAEAEARLIDGSGGVEALVPGGEDPKLVVETAETVLRHAGKRGLGIRVETRSNIPIGRGLKSSSAVSDAVALAVARLIDFEATDEEVVKLAVEASINAGVTITGAYDDAYTCFFGGVNITDNHARRVLLRMPAPEDLLVAISIPERRIYTRAIDVEELGKVREICLKAAKLALAGRIWQAMTLNGIAVASALDLDLEPILAALRSGALAAGVSGTGPAIAAVAKPEEVERVRSVLEPYGRVIVCRPNNRRASWEVLG